MPGRLAVDRLYDRDGSLPELLLLIVTIFPACNPGYLRLPGYYNLVDLHRLIVLKLVVTGVISRAATQECPHVPAPLVHELCKVWHVRETQVEHITVDFDSLICLLKAVRTGCAIMHEAKGGTCVDNYR